MNPSSAMALVSAGVMSTARAVVSASAVASVAERRFKLRVVFIVRYSCWVNSLVELFLHHLHLGCSPFAFDRFFFRPVKTHIHNERPFRRRQPVGFLFLAGGFVLDEERYPAVGILLELWQHRRVDQIAVDGIGNEQA